jgi:hypothetical protein
VLNLLNRGKRQRQHAAADKATPARPVPHASAAAVRGSVRCAAFLCANSSPSKYRQHRCRT